MEDSPSPPVQFGAAGLLAAGFAAFSWLLQPSALPPSTSIVSHEVECRGEVELVYRLQDQSEFWRKGFLLLLVLLCFLIGGVVLYCKWALRCGFIGFDWGHWSTHDPKRAGPPVPARAVRLNDGARRSGAA